jgi:putative nucleotidyltransferase with HDIG domain
MKNREIVGAVVSFMDITERKNYQHSLQQALEQTVQAVAAALEQRDPYTAGHQRGVAELAQAIGQEMGLEQKVVEGLYVGGIIHDIGKISIPAEILTKPGKLRNVEYELIKGHVENGQAILSGIEFPWPIIEMIGQHHERLDGSGYPRSLEGIEIILEARILAVADVVEAMYSHRPYRVGLGIDAALEEIQEGRSTRYDPEVVDSCLRLFAEDMFQFSKK